jgi:hypothetical protein
VDKRAGPCSSPASAQCASIAGVPAFLAQLMEALQDVAVQEKAFITSDEFRTFNSFIGEAITDAVKAFLAERETVTLEQGMQMHRQLGEFADEQRRLLDVALHTAAIIQKGGIATSEAITSTLMSTLQQLRDHIERSLPHIRLITGVTTTPRHTAG